MNKEKHQEQTLLASLILLFPASKQRNVLHVSSRLPQVKRYTNHEGQEVSSNIGRKIMVAEKSFNMVIIACPQPQFEAEPYPVAVLELVPLGVREIKTAKILTSIRSTKKALSTNLLLHELPCSTRYLYEFAYPEPLTAPSVNDHIHGPEIFKRSSLEVDAD